MTICFLFVCRRFAEIENAVVKLYPCMIEELDEKNYLLKFHILLHIEDLEVSTELYMLSKLSNNLDICLLAFNCYKEI